jgi:formyl-CoA transferase
LSKTPGSINWAGPKLGEHTEQVLKGGLELAEDKYDEWLASGVISDHETSKLKNNSTK